jgi:hypothetical protein
LPQHCARFEQQAPEFSGAFAQAQRLTPASKGFNGISTAISHFWKSLALMSYLMTSSANLANEDLYPNAQHAEKARAEFPFDDRPLAGATLEYSNHDQMLAVMRKYCAKLGRASVSFELVGLSNKLEAHLEEVVEIQLATPKAFLSLPNGD